MSATTFTGSVRSEQSWNRAKRAVLIAVAIVVLFAASFLIGRATAGTTSHVASTSPAATTLLTRECTQNGQAVSAPSHAGRAC
jgi:hypothetical protein